MVDGARFQQFSLVNDAAAATTKKLQKYAILADYLRDLDDDEDLRLAVRYAAGRAFAATDERVLGVGGALVSEVVLARLKLDPRAFHDLVVASGEIGEALSKVWPAPTRDFADTASPPPLCLQDLARAFDEIAATGDRDAKRAVLDDLFARCRSGREAAYLAKIIFRDLRTGVQEGVLHYAIAQAFARDGKQIQRCQLLVGDLGEVAVLARHDRCGAAQFRLFHPIQFMLATAQETPEEVAKTMDERTFYAEDKLDGIRAQVHKSGEGANVRVAIYTRTMDRTDGSFPDVVDAIARLSGDFLLDGEIVPWRDGCVLPFAHIQKRLGRKVLTPRMLRENPCAFIAFDLLYRDGALLMDRPLRERRAALAELAGRTSGGRGDAEGRGEKDQETRGHGDKGIGEDDGAEGTCQVVALSACAAAGCALLTPDDVTIATEQEVARAFENARRRRNEGIVLKDPESPYAPGRRGKMWLKLKTHLPTIDCVVTAAETGHGKRRNALSDYTFAVWDRDPCTDPSATLVNVGKAYIGVTDEEIAQLTETFTKLTVQQFGRVRLVRPEVVLEIACDQIQKSARHASGYALRFPRVKRIRWDKKPEDADRLARVIEIYESQANFGKSLNPPAPPEPTLFDHLSS